MPHRRLDQWLVEKGLFETREKARQAILAGRVYDGRSGAVLDKAGMKVSENLEVKIPEADRFVSRGGEKLEHFLAAIKLDVTNQICLDVGSSTGGFTDCLLQRGAKQVWAVDVGTHQLHEKLRADSRIRLFEQTDIRQFDFALLNPPPTIIVMDVSFISAKLILPLLFRNLANAKLILLFKPQFEAGRFVPKKKGIVSDETRQECLREFREYLIQSSFQIESESDSFVKGKEGNQETFFLILGPK